MGRFAHHLSLRDFALAKLWQSKNYPHFSTNPQNLSNLLLTFRGGANAIIAILILNQRIKMEFIKEFVLNYGRKIIDISFLLSFALATIIFLGFSLAVGSGAIRIQATMLVYVVFIFLCVIIALIALFYTIYLFVDIKDTLKEIRDKVSIK